jgi:hypothetical protein
MAPQEFAVFSAQLHPEFGYFWPSSRVRRMVWAALALGVLGLIAGAGSIGPMTGHDAGTEEVLMPALAKPAPDPEPVVRSESLVRMHPRPQLAGVGTGKTDVAKSDPAKACEEMTWAYLDGKCVAGKTRKPRIVRVPTHRPAIALVPLGRHVSAGTDIGASKASDGVDGKPTPAKSPKAADAASSTPNAALQAFATAKKPQRTAQSRTHRRSRSGYGDPWSRADRWGWRGTAQAWSW